MVGLNKFLNMDAAIDHCFSRTEEEFLSSLGGFSSKYKHRDIGNAQ
jgi:hypothetical protein